MRYTNADRDSLEGAVFAEQIRLLFDQRFTLGLNLGLATLTAVVFGPLFPDRLALVWLALFWSVILTRWLVGRYYTESTLSLKLARRRSCYYTAGVFVTASLWGLTGSVVQVTTDKQYLVLIVFVLAGMTAGGILTNASYRPAMFAFVLPATLPLILMLLIRRSELDLEMAAMLALFSAVLTVTGTNISRTIAENLRLRLQQEQSAGVVRASESSMAEAQAAARVGSYEFDPVTHTIGCTAEVFRIFDIDPATFDSSYETLLARVHPADLAALVASFDEFARTGEGTEVDCRIVMDDGTVKYLHATGHSVPALQGRPQRFFTTLQDVTEQVNAAKELTFRDSLLHAVTTGTTILLETDSIEAGMPQALKVMGESMRLDRVGLVQLTGDDTSTALRYEWHAPGVPGAPDPSNFTTRPSEVAAMTDARERLSAGTVLIAQRADGPGPFSALLEYMDIESLLIAPVVVEHELWGILNADSRSLARVWTANEIDTIKTFAGIAGSLVARYDARISLETSEAKLQFANTLLKSQMEASPDAILVVDPNRKIISINQNCVDMWALPPDVLEDARAALGAGSQLVRDRRKYLELVEYLDQHRDQDSEDEIGLLDGRTMDQRSRTLTAPDGTYLGRVWYYRDISARKRAESLAVRLANDDALTGLANRSVFVEALARSIAEAKTAKKGFGVIYLDLDHFKDVNDTLGHPVGDELLKAVATRLRANMRDGDTVARFGGDEFAVIVSKVVAPTDAAVVVDRLSAALSKPYSIQGNEIRSGASFGIDLYGPQSPDAETLLAHADVALYQAKSDGRGRYRFFTEAMEQEVRARVTLGEELRAALPSGQLFLVYEPQVAIDTGRITGLEALVRWRHPRLGVLTSDVFMPVAESTGVVVALGRWVLLAACRQVRCWLDDGVAAVRVAVNVSSLQFKTPLELERNIAGELSAADVPPKLLEIELADSVSTTLSLDHSQALARLRASGVSVAIDDFGTGPSSLGYLRRFPVDRIKIPRDFLTDLTTVAGQAAIAKATIGLARDLGIAVVAEGVERREQVDALRGWGCEEIQGCYFSEPLDVDEITLALRNGGVLSPQAVSSA
jgi:diguanylate cyclase (GGDEF)-like protein